MHKFFLVVITIISFTTAAQLQFVQAVGGLNEDQAKEIIKTSDNGYALAGWTNSYGAGGYDMMLSRFDSLGYHMWTRVVGGVGTDQARSVVETHEGGLVLAGYTNSFGAGNNDVFVVKFDAVGTLLWAKTYGIANSDGGEHIIETNDHGFAIAGWYTQSFPIFGTDMMLMKLDSLGNFSWATTYAGPSNESYVDVVQTYDNGYATTGYTYFFGSSDGAIMVVRYNSLGGFLWRHYIAAEFDPPDDFDKGNAIIETPDSGLVVAAETDRHSVAGGRDCLLMKFDLTGTHLWSKAWGGAAMDRAFSVKLTPDNGLVVAGATQSFGIGSDELILSKFDASGNHLWSSTVGDSNIDFGSSVFIAHDNGFVVDGHTNNFGVDSIDMIFAKYDSVGNTCIGETISPTVDMITPAFQPWNLTEAGRTLTEALQTPDVVIVVPDTHIICYNDIVPPIIFNLLSPPDSTLLADPRPTFIWEASFDSASGLMDYEVYINDTLRHTSAETTWTVDYDLSEGYNDWYIIAYDSALNARVSNQIWTLLIDTSGPLIDSTTIWNDTTYVGPFPVYTKVTDFSNVDSVLLFYKRIEDPTWFSVEMASGGDNWYYEEIPQVFQQDDTVKYYIYATDELQHNSTDPTGAPGNYYSFIANVFTAITEHQDIPKVFSFGLKQNPTRGRALFNLALPQDAMVNLNIYDVLGRLVDQPLAGKKSAGFYELPWTPPASGVYFYKLDSPWQKRVGKLVLLK